MLRIASLFPAAALALAAGCSRAPAYSDPAVPITVAAGESFELTLAANESTGYRWSLADSARLGPVQLVGHAYRSNAPARNGAGGSDRWSFRAARPGNAVISLIYSRSFEPGVPADTTRFRVTVR